MARFILYFIVGAFALGPLVSTAEADTKVRYLKVKMQNTPFAVDKLRLWYNSGNSLLDILYPQAGTNTGVVKHSEYGIWDDYLTDGEWIVIDLAALSSIREGGFVFFEFRVVAGKMKKYCRAARTLIFDKDSSNMAFLKIGGTSLIPSCDWDKNNNYTN